MKNKLLLPVLIGATVAWFLISDDTADLRDDLLEKVANTFDSVKDKLTDRIPN